MATPTVLGGFPINIIDEQGKEYGIPLSLLSFDNNGGIDISLVVSKYSLDDKTKANTEKVVKSLFDAHAISAPPPAAPVLAMTLTAAFAGEGGNSLTVTFSNPAPDDTNPPDGKIDVKIGWTDRRAGLTVASIGQQLGTPNGGTAPSLVALAADATALPAAVGPTALGGNPLEFGVNAADASPAFKLVTSYGDPLIAGMKIEIAEVDSNAGTFTLIVTVDFSTPDVKLTDLAATLAPLVTLTPGANELVMPAEGIVTFAGGATDPPQAAKALVLTD